MDSSQTPSAADLEQFAKLDSMIAAQEAAEAAPAATATPPAGNKTGQQATAQPGAKATDNKGPEDQAANRGAASEPGKDAGAKEGANAPENKSGTQSTAAPGGAATDKSKEQQQQQQQQPEQGSKYARDQQRRNDSWKALNEEKTALAAERQKFQDELARERSAVQAERAQLQREQDAANASNKPETYEQYVASERAKAEKLEKAAKAAEEAGDFDKAEQLNKAASLAREFERLAKTKAEELRRNPPPDQKAREAQFQSHQKEWMLKAAVDFPEFGKSQSGTQQEAVSFMQQVAQRWPEAAKLPGLIYFAAERAALKTAADRVPALEKERTELNNKVAELTKRVAELDALTNPTPEAGAARLPAPKSFDQKSSEEQFADLRAEAANL